MPQTRPAKRVVTPLERLKRKITKEFDKKILIGDIPINDAEFEILIEYFQNTCKMLFQSNSLLNDQLFATALVQIGIKNYDGNFWGHVAQILGMDKLNSTNQGVLGGSFIKTLLLHKKVILNKNERVRNILMHGFVSDQYATEMFTFLFKYYNIDLERDLQRNSREMMNNLIKTIQRKDNTGRTYLLVQQTADAINANTRGGKIRIRRLLRLIDKCFWDQITPANSINRLSKLFINWQDSSCDFKSQYEKHHNVLTANGGKKSFSSPYLHCNYAKTVFKLILPTQLVNFEYSDNIQWIVSIKEKQVSVNTSLYEAVTGYKTEPVELLLKEEDLFEGFTIELLSENTRIKLFKIKKDCIRFFDRDGDYLNSYFNLPKGEVYAFTTLYETPLSEALIDNEPLGSLVKSYFEFEYGDIVRLPDGKAISIGKKIEEGLLSRNSLKSAYALENNIQIPIYSSSPSILLKIEAKKANGTLVEINGMRYRLFDQETTVVELNDRSGETGYIINLGAYGCTEDNIYSIYIDVPNDHKKRTWHFALIKGINYFYQDAPYIFQSRGTIQFNEGLVVTPQNNRIEKNTGENSYNFEIQPDMNYIYFDYNTGTQNIYLFFEIPVLKWKFGNGQWNIEKPSDIWHSDFPSEIYLKFPADKLTLSMDDPLENNLEYHEVQYNKLKEKDEFECDTTRFKSWFGREKVARSIFLDLPKKRLEFIRVITKSVVVSHILKEDFHSDKLIGQLDIIVNSNYYVDVKTYPDKEVVASKLPVINGVFILDNIPGSGLFEITVFEDEEDDTGFGSDNYLFIAKFKYKLINPYNLHGKNLLIKHLKRGKGSTFKKELNWRFYVTNLKKINEKNYNLYKGSFISKSPNGYIIDVFEVTVEVMDMDKLHYVYLSFFDGYDDLELLYDSSQNVLVRKEEKGLSRSVRYRRYECLYHEEYIYVVEFTDEVPKFQKPSHESSSIIETIK